MAQTAHQLNASMERVRQARQLLHEASDRLAQTRQQVEEDQRLEHVRSARQRLDEANQRLTLARHQWEEDQPWEAPEPAPNDDPMNGSRPDQSQGRCGSERQ